MNRLAWLLGSGALVVWSSASALGGCGTSEATVDDSNVDGGEAGSTSGGTSGSPGAEGGTTTDGGTGTDGSTTDGGTKEGGATEGGVSTPNKVQCAGGTQCNTPADVCCVRQGDAGCQPAGDQCMNGAKLRCDEKADCPNAGDICCAGFGGGAASTECRTTCQMQQVQVCKTNAECSGGTCYVNTCPTMGGATIVVQACSKIPLCTQ